MIHDRELLDVLDGLPKEAFSGQVFRATRQSLDPLVSSTSGGRRMPTGAAGVLYTSLKREGALAEISFHWSQLSPRPTKPVMLHTLGVVAQLAPSARWPCDNLMLFPDSMGGSASLELLASENVDWVRWATDQGLLK